MTPRCGAPAGARLFIRDFVRPEVPRVVALQEFGVLESGAGVEDHDFVRFGDPAAAPQLARHREGAPPFGTEKEPLAFAGERHRIGDLVVAHRQSRAFRLAKRPEDDEIAERLWDAD